MRKTPVSRPKVTVCIPTYNYGRFIEETLESVLTQDFTDYELLVVDDCSSDNTVSLVKAYEQRDDRVKLVVNPCNLGMVQNWNHCIELAQGEYIKFVFGDDVLSSSNALRRMVDKLDEDESVSLVATARKLIDAQSAVKGTKCNFSGDRIFSGTDVINYCLFQQRNLVGEPSVVMFRKSQALRGFNASYRQIVDLEMWFHLLEQGTFVYIDEPLCAFRVHERQQTAISREEVSDLKDVFYLLNDYIKKDYITLADFTKKYLLYDHVHSVWKRSRKNPARKKAAVELINSYYDFKRFPLWYPLYKLFKPCFKLYKKSIKLT